MLLNEEKFMRFILLLKNNDALYYNTGDNKYYQTLRLKRKNRREIYK